MSVKSVIVNICRFVVAPVFIFSGYVKAVDPLGTQYKIQDYLAAAGLPSLPDWLTLSTSVALCALEFTLGILLLFAIHRRTVSKVITGFMLVMTPITLWLAIANPVQDCGCFGDAIHLTNWQTFGKNVVLLLMALIISRWPLSMVRFISRANQWIVINYTILYIVATSLWSLWTLPRFDFRPYHIGADLREGMRIPDDAPQPQFETTFILEKDGKQQEFTLDNYPDSTWTFIDSKTVQTAEGYIPPIHDFSMTRMDDDEDITEQVINDPGYTFLLVAPFLDKADDSNFGIIDQIYEYSDDFGYPFYGLTSSDERAVQHWRDITGAEYPFCQCDGTTLKTIIRSNPGLLLLHDGKVVMKWSHNQLPDPALLTQPLEKLPLGTPPDTSAAPKIATILLWFALPLFLLTLADRLWAWTRRFRKKEKKEMKDEKEIREEPHQQ